MNYTGRKDYVNIDSAPKDLENWNIPRIVFSTLEVLKAYNLGDDEIECLIIKDKEGRDTERIPKYGIIRDAVEKKIKDLGGLRDTFAKELLKIYGSKEVEHEHFSEYPDLLRCLFDEKYPFLETIFKDHDIPSSILEYKGKNHTPIDVDLYAVLHGKCPLKAFMTRIKGMESLILKTAINSEDAVLKYTSRKYENLTNKEKTLLIINDSLPRDTVGIRILLESLLKERGTFEGIKNILFKKGNAVDPARKVDDIRDDYATEEGVIRAYKFRLVPRLGFVAGEEDISVQIATPRDEIEYHYGICTLNPSDERKAPHMIYKTPKRLEQKLSSIARERKFRGRAAKKFVIAVKDRIKRSGEILGYNMVPYL